MITIYDSDGRPLAATICPPSEVAKYVQHFGGVGHVDGHHLDARIVGGKPVQRAERPSDRHVYDYAAGQWHDPRTEAEKQADAEEEARAIRLPALAESDVLLLRRLEQMAPDLAAYRQQLRDLPAQVVGGRVPPLPTPPPEVTNG